MIVKGHCLASSLFVYPFMVLSLKEQPASITLMYPNDTTVTITGDQNVVQQLVNCVANMSIEYERYVCSSTVA